MSSKSKFVGLDTPTLNVASDDEVRFALALKQAYDPDSLATERHEALLARALGFDLAEPDTDDVFAPPTPEELEQSALLSRAIDGQATHPLADLATALKHAHAPQPLSSLGLERALRVKTHSWAKPAAGAGVALALAATFALVWLPRQQTSDRTTAQQRNTLLASRSLAPLFAEEFSQGTTTARMDRIVMARSRDLRHNRYLAWRVR